MCAHIGALYIARMIDNHARWSPGWSTRRRQKREERWCVHEETADAISSGVHKTRCMGDARWAVEGRKCVPLVCSCFSGMWKRVHYMLVQTLLHLVCEIKLLTHVMTSQIFFFILSVHDITNEPLRFLNSIYDKLKGIIWSSLWARGLLFKQSRLLLPLFHRTMLMPLIIYSKNHVWKKQGINLVLYLFIFAGDKQSVLRGVYAMLSF